MNPLPALLAALALASVAGAHDTWTEYLGGPDRNHYSPLTEINAANVARLRPAWTYHSGDFGEMEGSPIVVGGVLYAPTSSIHIVALDAATGQLRWQFSDPDNPFAKGHHRGVTYWTDGAERRIFGSIGSWLYALDADTGKAIPSFGTDGRVSLKTGLGARAQDKFVDATTPGTLFGDLIVMPTRDNEDATAAPGYIQAFNVRTGALVWTFRTIPYPGEFGYETWSKEAYLNSDVGAANCWAGMSIDRARGILYVPTGSAAPDFWGGHRLGSNLFANCLLALDVRTGKRLWHYQIVRHDVWDRDLPAPPNLVTIRRNGRTVDAVAQITKSGHVFVFDRVTGESLFPIREVPVPKSELKGEELAATEPLPVLPEPFTRQAVTAADISPYAPNREELVNEARQSRTGAFQPFGKTHTLIMPGFGGGGEWGGAAVDPAGTLYINANEVAYLEFMVENPTEAELAAMSRGRRLYAVNCIGCHGAERKGTPAAGFPSLVEIGARRTRAEIVRQIATGKGMMPGFTQLSAQDLDSLAGYLSGDEKTAADSVSTPAETGVPQPYRISGYGRFIDRDGRPASAPPWGTLTAIDLNTGLHRWHIALGEDRELAAKGFPQTGAENWGGPVVTAGGVLFIAATKDARFHAFDVKTGQKLWEADLPAAGFATPCTYEANGKQYVVIACGGNRPGAPAGDSYVAFALP